MKIDLLFRELAARGWRHVRTRGSHHVFTHPDAARSVTVAVHGKEINDHVAKSILKQADAALKKAD